MIFAHERHFLNDPDKCLTDKQQYLTNAAKGGQGYRVTFD